MENPQNSVLRAVKFVLLGIVIGAIPGLIQVDQMRRELQADTAQAQKLSVEARKQILEAMGDAVEAKRQIDVAHQDCQNAILGDGARTILLDLNHPWGSPIQQVMGVSLTLPPPGNSSFATGPMWVIPRAITPHVVDGVLGAAYTHIWPDGRSDGWQRPSRAE